MFALLHGGGCDGGMKIVGGTDHHGIEILLLFEKFAEINIGGATAILAGALLGGVQRVDNFLGGFATGNAAGDAKSVAELNGFIGAKPVPAAIDAE